MKDTEFVLVRKKEYLSLLNDSNELAELECLGVDNWEGYGECDWEEIEEAQENTYSLVRDMKSFDKDGKEL